MASSKPRHSPPSLGIPPLAGLATYDEAGQIGWSVDQNVERLRRLNYVKKRLYDLSAAFMNPTPEWEIKCALSLHMWLDSEHAASFRTRVAELRRPPLYLDKTPDPRLEALMNELQASESSLELLVAVFQVIRPALARAYERHLKRSNPVFDHPTRRILRIALQEEREMIAWGRSAAKALTKTEKDETTAKAWKDHLHAFLAQANGIDGDEKPSKKQLPTPRAKPDFVPSFDPRRDPRSGDIYNFNYRPGDVYMDAKAPMPERNLALMYKRFHEMDVPEMMASIVGQTPGKPWDYYREMGRQIWDECRHAMMGEVWFARHGVDWSKYPNHVGWVLHLNMDLTPIERHIILFFIEQSLMDGKIGKKLEWEIAKSAADPLATFFQDYDWADEVLHAQIGRRWLKPEVGDVKQILTLGKQIAQRPEPIIEQRRKLHKQIDWWPDFVREVLGTESAANQGEKLLIPKFNSLASG